MTLPPLGGIIPYTCTHTLAKNLKTKVYWSCLHLYGVQPSHSYSRWDFTSHLYSKNKSSYINRGTKVMDIQFLRDLLKQLHYFKDHLRDQQFGDKIDGLFLNPPNQSNRRQRLITVRSRCQRVIRHHYFIRRRLDLTPLNMLCFATARSKRIKS